MSCLFMRSDQARGIKVRLKCHCGFKINDAHLRTCAKLRETADTILHPWTIASIERTTSGDVLALTTGIRNEIAEALSSLVKKTC